MPALLSVLYSEYAGIARAFKAWPPGILLPVFCDILLPFPKRMCYHMDVSAYSKLGKDSLL